MHGSWISCQTERVWLVFLWSNSSKSAGWPVWKSIYFESRRSYNIRFGWQIDLIQRIPLYTLPQVLLLSLPLNHVTLTILFISIYRVVTVTNLGSKNNSLIEVHRELLRWGSNVIAFWSVLIMWHWEISPVIERLHSYIQTLKSSWTNILW